MVLASLVGVIFLANEALADRGRHGSSGVCTQTAKLQYSACRAELYDDYFTAKAACINEPEEAEECVSEARSERRDGYDSCREQLEAREDLCGEIGQAAYSPDMPPDLFQDPRNPSQPNPYFPLDIDRYWIYEEDGERIEIRILDETKRIAGIDCMVYRDVVTEDGDLVEDTNDWFAIRKNGDIVYCGRRSRIASTSRGTIPRFRSSRPSTVDSRWVSTSRRQASAFWATRSWEPATARSGIRATPRTSARCSRTATGTERMPSWTSSFPRRSQS